MGSGALMELFQGYGTRWEENFDKNRNRFLREKDLMLLMGTIHRFPAVHVGRPT